MKMRCAVLSVLGLLIAASWAAAAPAFEKLFPDNTVAFVTVRSVPTLQQRLKQHTIYQIWQEPSVQKFLEKPMAKLSQKIQEAEAKTGVKLGDVWSLFHGQVALGVTLEANFNDDPAFLLLVDVGADGDRAMKLIATLNDTAAKEGEPAKRSPVEETFEGARLVHLRQAPGAAAADKEGRWPTYGLLGDVLIIGNSDAAIKRTISFLKAPPETALATCGAWRAVVEKTGPGADILAFGNVAPIVQAVKNQPPNPDSPAPETPRILEALGLNGFGGIGLGVNYTEDTWRGFVQTLGERKGIAKILTPAPGELNSGAEAPADAAMFMSVRFDPNEIYGEIEKILAMAAPQALAAINSQMSHFAQQIGEPFNLRKDILAVFGPRLAVYTRYELPYKITTSEQIVVIADIASKAAFNAAWDKLGKIAPQIFGMFQQREYLGRQIFALTPPKAPGAEPPPGEQPKIPAFVVTDREFIFSPSVEALEGHLRRASAQGPSLRDRPEFREALALLPADGRIMIVFGDKARQTEFLLRAFKDSDFMQLFENARKDPKFSEILDLFDMNLLPDPADITRHLTPSAACVIVQPDGLLLVSRTKPKPPAPAK